MPTGEELGKYAEVAIKVGLGLGPGDRLVIMSNIDAREFTRMLAETAYGAGAVNVDIIWQDDAVTRYRFERGSDEAAEAVSGFGHLLNATVAGGDHLLQVKADDPDLLAEQDPGKVAAHTGANSSFIKPMREATGSLKKNWSIVAAPTPTWARAVFPALGEDDAIEELWGAILRTCRIDQPDPVEAWQGHIQHLAARSAFLTERQYDALRYSGPGTDLTVGLPNGHVWMGGQAKGPSGVGFVPNLPTEEVFTSPDRNRADGIVASTKPLSLFGTLVEDFTFTMKDGKVVEATAARGQQILDKALAIDDGAVRFGENAIVPESSAVAREGLIWQNILFDENDACHIALGRGFATAVAGGGDLTVDELLDRGINDSAIHVDFVVGSDRLNVYGVDQTGSEDPLLIGGEWAFSV